MLLQAHERHRMAVPYLERAQSLQPGELRWAYYLGISLERLGQHARAADSFRTCAAIDRGFLPAQRRLAALLLESGEVEASVAAFRQLAAEKPGDPKVRYGLGRAEMAAGNLQLARDQFLEAIELAAGYAAARYALAQAYAQLGMTAEADRQLELFERDRHIEPPSDDRLLEAVSALRLSAAEYLARGVAAREQGQVSESIALHLRALEEDPALLQARVNLVILFGSTGRTEEAEEQYRLGLAAGEGTAELHYNYGVVAYRAGRPADAGAAFRQALEISPGHALANHNLGQLLEEEGRFDLALDRYQRAIANRPDHGLSHYKIGMLRMRERRADEAVAAFREAAKEDSDRNPTYVFSLAAAQLASGNRGGAIGAFRRARTGAERHGQEDLVARIDRALQELGVSPVAP